MLATIAALGNIAETELRQLATEADVSLSVVASVVQHTTRGGLLEVTPHRRDNGDLTRTYTLRPPLLADVLVTERAFTGRTPMLDFGGLADRWPGRIGALAAAAIEAARLGAEMARSRAERLLHLALSDPTVPHQAKV